MRVLLCALLASASTPAALAQVKARIPADITPAWNQGLQPISRESYWNAVECGKQGGASPPCVFYDTGLCGNDQFVLSLYSPYKFVAYSVWLAVSKGQPAPTPSYAQAQQTRAIVGVKALTRQNPIATVNIRRGGRVVPPATQTLDGGGGTFIFDFAAFAPTAAITIELVGKASTVTCAVDRATLARFR